MARTISRFSSQKGSKVRASLDWWPAPDLAPTAKEVLAEALLDPQLSEDARELVRALAFYSGRINVGDPAALLWLEFSHGLTRPRLRRAVRELLHAAVVGLDGIDNGLEVVAFGAERQAA